VAPAGLSDNGNATSTDLLIELGAEHGDMDDSPTTASPDAADQFIELATERGDLATPPRPSRSWNATITGQNSPLSNKW
jgi:hypothetical protein